jgi:hypothetical protein
MLSHTGLAMLQRRRNDSLNRTECFGKGIDRVKKWCLSEAKTPQLIFKYNILFFRGLGWGLTYLFKYYVGKVMLIISAGETPLYLNFPSL